LPHLMWRTQCLSGLFLPGIFLAMMSEKRSLTPYLPKRNGWGWAKSRLLFSGKPLMTDMTVDEVLQNIQAKCEQYMDVGTLHPAELDNVLLFVWRHANELKGRGLVGRAESQNRTIDEFYGMGKPNPPRKRTDARSAGGLISGTTSPQLRYDTDRRGGWRQLGVYEG
jgi:hypothetical protein